MEGWKEEGWMDILNSSSSRVMERGCQTEVHHLDERLFICSPATFWSFLLSFGRTDGVSMATRPDRGCLLKAKYFVQAII